MNHGETISPFCLWYSQWNIFSVFLVYTKWCWMLSEHFVGKLSPCIVTHWAQSIFKILAHLGSCLSSDTGAFLFLQPLPSSGLAVSHRARMLSDEKTFSQQLHLARLLLSISPCHACFPHNFWLWSCCAPLPCQLEESVFLDITNTQFTQRSLA